MTSEAFPQQNQNLIEILINSTERRVRKLQAELDSTDEKITRQKLTKDNKFHLTVNSLRIKHK